MNYYFSLNEHDKLQIHISLFGVIKLYHNGNEIQRSKEKGKPYIISKVDGTISRITFKAGFDVVPIMYVDGQVISLAPKSPIYVYIFSFLPLILLSGGLLGGLLGGASVAINMGIFRSQMPTVAKILLSLCSFVVVIVMFIIVILAVYAPTALSY